VLQRIMNAAGGEVAKAANGFAVAFGPGLAAESFRFKMVA
jgi:predicted naringenin-chalcone synthase